MMNFNNFKNNFGKVIQIVNFVKRCKLVLKKKKKNLYLRTEKVANILDSMMVLISTISTIETKQRDHSI